MDYKSIGQIGQHMKHVSLSAKWEKKQKTGDLTEKQSILRKDFKAEHEKEREEMLPLMKEMAEKKDHKMAKIEAKIKSGADLTYEEKEYLKKNAPDKYKAVQKSEQEEKAYAEALKRCKTKEDVQRLKQQKMGHHLSTVKSIINNPNIPEGKKLEYVLEEHRKVQVELKVEEEFIRSGAYSEMPTEAEVNEERHEEAEAEKAERTGENRQNAEETSEKEIDTTLDEQKEAAENDKRAEFEINRQKNQKQEENYSDKTEDTKEAMTGIQQTEKPETEKTKEATDVKTKKAQAYFEGAASKIEAAHHMYRRNAKKKQEFADMNNIKSFDDFVEFGFKYGNKLSAKA